MTSNLLLNSLGAPGRIINNLIERKKENSLLTQNSVEQDSVPLQFLKKNKGTINLNFIESDEIPEGASPTINKTINNSNSEEKPQSFAPSLFGGGTTTGTGQSDLKTGMSTGTIVGLAGAGVLLVFLYLMFGGKK